MATVSVLPFRFSSMTGHQCFCYAFDQIPHPNVGTAQVAWQHLFYGSHDP